MTTYKVDWGYTFDADGNTIPETHEFKTLEQANEFRNKICRETGYIVCVYQ